MTADADPDPELAALALAYAQLYLEVECGLRPRWSLDRMMDRRLQARLADHWVRPGARLRRPDTVRVWRCGPDCFEAVVIATGGRRAGALALRLERRRGRWRVVEAARPEDGVLPEPEASPPIGELCAFELVLPPRERPALVGAGPAAVEAA